MARRDRQHRAANGGGEEADAVMSTQPYKSGIMGNSGIEWVDAIYDWAVIALVNMATYFGITYEEINVWVFVILMPIAFLSTASYVVFLRFKIARMRRRIKDME
jgi:hypothetical protein